jgi:hypothetical protein
MSLVDKVDGCKAEIIEASLVFAENARTQVRIEGTVTDLTSVEKQLEEIQDKRGAEEAARAEELLPVGITDRLTPPQLKAIVAHELCHVRRRDNLLRFTWASRPCSGFIPWCGGWERD